MCAVHWQSHLCCQWVPFITKPGSTFQFHSPWNTLSREGQAQGITTLIYTRNNHSDLQPSPLSPQYWNEAASPGFVKLKCNPVVSQPLAENGAAAQWPHLRSHILPPYSQKSRAIRWALSLPAHPHVQHSVFNTSHNTLQGLSSPYELLQSHNKRYPYD